MNWIRAAGLRLLLSLGLAFSLWIYVSFRENPNSSTSYEGVPVEVENLAPGLVNVDRNGLPVTTRQEVTVSAEGTQAVLQTLRPSDIRAFTDLEGLGPGEHQVPVNIATTRSGLARLTFSARPDLVSFRIEQEITSTVPLTVEVTGSVPFSFEQRPAETSVDNTPVTSAEVRGPENRVAMVSYVRATADINQRTANYNSPRQLEAVGADGVPIEGVTVSPGTVDVLVPIISSVGIKRVPVIPQVTGRPASGQFVSDISVSPEFVTLTGGSGPLDEADSVSTEPVDISNASGVISRTVSLRRPAGVALLETETQTVTVTIRTAPINQPFTVSLPAQVVAANQPPGLLVNISPDTVQVTLSGAAGQINALSSSNLQGQVDLTGLDPGTYSLTPSFNLPQGVTITNQPNVSVTLRLPAPTATDTPTETPEGPGPAPTGPAATTVGPEPTAAPESTPEPNGTAAPADAAAP